MLDIDVESLIEKMRKNVIVDRSELSILKGQTLTGNDLSGLNFSGCDLSETVFFGCNLKGANFFQSNLCKCDFTGADVSESIFSEAKLDGCSFGKATMNNTNLFNASLIGSTLTGAKLFRADLRTANLTDARMRETELLECDLTGSIICRVDMSFSQVRGSVFNDVDMSNTVLRHIKGYQEADWIGVDIRNVNFSGAYRTRRFIVDQNYLYEFKTQSTFYLYIYYIWKLTSDCGRSLLRWMIVILFQILCYALLYSFMDLNFETERTWFSYIYFSVVTTTTLGYGDIIPVSTTAQFVSMSQVFLGYIMLGGFLSILTNKMARRAD